MMAGDSCACDWSGVHTNRMRRGKKKEEKLDTNKGGVAGPTQNYKGNKSSKRPGMLSRGSIHRRERFYIRGGAET